MTTTISTILALALCMLVAVPARAETRLTVYDFYGPSGRSLRGDVEGVFKSQPGLTLVSKEQVADTARRLGVDAFSPEGRKVLSRELNLSAWVMGIVKKSSGKLRLTVVMYDGADHTRIARTVVAGQSTTALRGAVKRQLWQQSEGALALALPPLPAGRGELAAGAPSGAGPAKISTSPGAAETQDPLAAEIKKTSTISAPAPETSFLYVAPPTPSAAARPDSPQVESPGKQRSEALRVFVGIGSPYRSLVYSDPVTSTLGDYQLSGVPMFDMSLAYYPGLPFTRGFASWLGVEAAAQVAVGSSAVDSDGNKYTARYDAYRMGARARLPVGKHFVSAFSGYTISRFSTTPDNKGVVAPNPDVDYRAIRSGLGGDLNLMRSMALGMDAAWLQMLSVGELGSWFPRTTAGGFELSVYATYALSAHFFARLMGTYRHHFFDFHSKPGDERSAGGATDQYLTAALSIGVGL